MNRRDLLKFGAVAGLGGSGCASLLSNPAASGAADMGAFLAALDGSLGAILPAASFDPWLPPGADDALRTRARAGEELTRKTLRSLLLVGTLGELSPEQQAHEGVQQRLLGHMGEFDDAVFGMTEMLEGLPAGERTKISKALADDPQLGMRIMGAFDQEAAAMGVSLKQRTKLRSISALACTRLRQSPQLVIDEYTAKVRKVEARQGARAERERLAAAAITDALLWQQADALSLDVQPVAGGSVPAPPLVSAEVPRRCTTPSDCGDGMTCQNYRDLGNGNWSQGECVVAPKKRKGSPGVLTAGGIIMGVAATGALALLPVNYLAAATVGAVVGAIGIVVLLIGLIMLAAGN